MAARKAKKRGKSKAKAAPSVLLPSVVSPHMDALCEWVARGGTLVDYCQVHGLSTRTVNYHLHRNADAAAAYARAREAQADAIAAELLRLADDCSEDEVQSTRTKIDTRKWLLSSHMTRSELAQTALKCVLTSVEHRVREHFLYRGERVFGPHFHVEALHGLCTEFKLDPREPMPGEPEPEADRRASSFI